MEYLTIEEKSAIMLPIKKQLLEIDEGLKNCKDLGISDEFWQNFKKNILSAVDKINKQDSLEVIEMRKTYENTEPCKH